MINRDDYKVIMGILLIISAAMNNMITMALFGTVFSVFMGIMLIRDYLGYLTTPTTTEAPDAKN